MPALPTLTVDQAADLLQVSPKTVRRWVADGRLPAYRLGARALRIRPDDLDRLHRRVPARGAR